MGNVGWGGILAAGWPVLSILLIGSIITIAITKERWKLFKKINPNSQSFLNSIRKNAEVNKILQFCDRSDQPLAFITAKILRAAPNREDRERHLGRAIQALVQKYEARISVLGTIASVAPFVGLLGTVIGIIKAFKAVSMASSAGAGLVAVGIAEALVGTAAGLVVAIPALLSYNYFVNKIRRFTQDWELVGAEIIDFSLSRKG